MSAERDILVSDDVRVIIEIVNYVVICGGVSIFGTVANSINIIIFFRQGLKTTMNISFFGLAISDLCGLFLLFWFTIFLNPWVENSQLPLITREFQYLVVGWPYECFSRISNLITAFVAAERCLSITYPLKVKRIITRRRATAVVCCIYGIMFLSLLPEYATSYIDWKFYAPKNDSRLGLVFTKNRKSMEGLVFILNAFLGALSYLLVVMFTAVLMWKLKHNSAWRNKTALYSGEQSLALKRDRKAMSMVLMIASVLVVLSSPSVMCLSVTFIVSDFSILGFYTNIFFTCWSFAFTASSVKSSIDIFLYYKMSSKYRKTFLELFSK
ncbi:unnamed protein product, partial [Lymnaea stagnalis]